MECRKCKAEIDDKNRFCPFCGTLVESGKSQRIQDIRSRVHEELEKADQSEEPVKQEPQPYADIPQQDEPEDDYEEEGMEEEIVVPQTAESSPYIRRLRSKVILVGKSPLFFAAVLLYTVSKIVPLLESGGGFSISNILGALALVDEYGILSYIGEYMESIIGEIIGGIGLSMTMLNVLLNLPVVLTVIGLCMICFSVTGKSYDLSTAANGCRTIKVVCIVVYVTKSLLWLAVFLMLASMLSQASFMQEFLAIGTVAVLIVAICTIYYGICVCRSLDAGIVASVGTTMERVSGFLIFCCICGGILTVLGSGLDWIEIADGTASILFGAVLHRYNKMGLPSEIL